MKNSALLIIGGVSVVGVGIYFFTRKSSAETLLEKGLNEINGKNTPKSGSVAGSTSLASTAVGTTGVGSTGVGSTGLPSTSINLGYTSPVIDNNGNLSGSTSGQPSDTTSSADYQNKLNLANIAFEEWKALKAQASNYVKREGTCRNGHYYGSILSCYQYYTASDDYGFTISILKKITEKANYITSLGFKPVGDKLFLI